MSDEPALPPSIRVAVVGGGAAGFFAAIACAEAGGGPVVLLEKSSMLLAKVKISGGGRCNVTHACFDPAVLVTRYPRGGRELRGPLHHFQPTDTITWFESRGVRLKTEADGRMFPISDRCRDHHAMPDGCGGGGRRARCPARWVEGAARVDDRFRLSIAGGRMMDCERLIVTTGGARSKQGGPSIAAEFGHTLIDPVPSLFTFHIDDSRLQGLAGLSVERARCG